MTTETIEPIISPKGTKFGGQLVAFRAVTQLAQHFPQFEGAYVTFSRHYPNEVSIQACSFAELEAWREALGAGSSLVHSRSIGADVELYFEAPAFGASIRVYAMDLLASAVAA
ncbi:hypothetical protein [Streptomyces shenzhenensis]|uniref:Uncharacterized protein n=1 Tax=Streptomyces shenzhenensis TaxID=943815 RepID=A0A3M0IH57_9ACTN|nr:hypothetical protein [Streptomyces shenzhenensis]RMB85589.1 hypothetical protein CTZ28_12410 [Streptomyces shenzhenensis]